MKFKASIKAFKTLIEGEKRPINILQKLPALFYSETTFKSF